MDITKAIYDRLASDAALVAWAATYGGGPGIFTEKKVPEDAHFPFVWSPDNIADTPVGNKLQPAREIYRDIWFCERRTGDASSLRNAALRGRNLFDRPLMSVEGGTTIISSCSGPIPGETDDNIDALIITVRLVIDGPIVVHS